MVRILYIYICISVCVHVYISHSLCVPEKSTLSTAPFPTFSAFLHVVHDSYSQQVSGSLAGPLRQLQYAGTTLRLGQIWKKDPARDAKDTEMSTIFEENAWKLNDDGCVWPNCTAKQDQHSRNIDSCAHTQTHVWLHMPHAVELATFLYRGSQGTVMKS